MKRFFWIYAFLLLSCGSSAKENEVKDSNERSEPAAVTQQEKMDSKGTVVFFGNSLTAGYGLEQSESFPSLIQEKIDSLGLPYQVVNAGLSGETTASGKNRLDWILNQGVDVFVLELGANDGLRGIPLEETERNLQAMIDLVREKHPRAEIVLAGMKIPPNMGPEYTEAFDDIYPNLAEKNNIALIPFLLDGVAGIANLNQRDGIHPTAEGQILVCKNVWAVLEPLLN
jgi:acyl-CoA thioesterase-1